MQADLQVADRQVLAMLQRLSALGRGQALPFMTEVGGHMVTTIRLRFDQQRGPGGARWWPSNRASKEGGQTLRLTSALRNSITFNATAQAVDIGTNVIYAARHHFGFRGIVQIPEHRRLVEKAFGKTLPFPVWATVKAHAAYGFTPRREFLGFDAQDRADILDIAREHIDRLVGPAPGAPL
jgi:phage gpG-like protein